MPFKSVLLTLLSAITVYVHADSRLLGTSGVTGLEGGAGGGLTPWAVISGYSDDSEVSAGAF